MGSVYIYIYIYIYIYTGNIYIYIYIYIYTLDMFFAFAARRGRASGYRGGVVQDDQDVLMTPGRLRQRSHQIGDNYVSIFVATVLEVPFFVLKKGVSQYFCPYSVCTSYWCLVMSFRLNVCI